MAIKVFDQFCPQNHPCPAVHVCKFGAITQEGFNAPKIDEEKCVECGLCARFCGFGAIQMVKEDIPAT